MIIATIIAAATSHLPQPDTDSMQVLVYGAVVGGAILVVNLVNSVLQIVRHFKKNPPIHETFATKGELKQLRDDTKQGLRSLREENNLNFKEIFDSLRGIERSLGRLEGNVDGRN